MEELTLLTIGGGLILFVLFTLVYVFWDSTENVEETKQMGLIPHIVNEYKNLSCNVV